MRISKLHIKLVLIPTIMLFCFQSVFAGYGASFTRESLKKNQLNAVNKTISSQSLSKIYCQVLFETDKENGLNAITKRGEKKYKRKNPNIVFGIAFIPGFFIHGLGHYYIGEYWTGTKLLAVELISIGVLFGAIVSGIASMDSPKDSKPNLAIWEISGLALFFGSWIYDYIAAPTKAIKMNQKHESAFYIYPEIKADKVTLNFACSFDEL